MIKSIVFLCALVLLFWFVGTANSTLLDRGGGLVYDDVLDITWLHPEITAFMSRRDPCLPFQMRPGSAISAYAYLVARSNRPLRKGTCEVCVQMAFVET